MHHCTRKSNRRQKEITSQKRETNEKITFAWSMALTLTKGPQRVQRRQSGFTSVERESTSVHNPSSVFKQETSIDEVTPPIWRRSLCSVCVSVCVLVCACLWVLFREEWGQTYDKQDPSCCLRIHVHWRSIIETTRCCQWSYKHLGFDDWCPAEGARPVRGDLRWGDRGGQLSLSLSRGGGATLGIKQRLPQIMGRVG